MLAGVYFAEEQGQIAPLERRAVGCTWYAFPFTEIKYDHKTFVLRQPLIVKVFQDDGLWYSKDEGEHFLACGDSMERAIHSLSEDFCVYWRVIAEAYDSDLDEGAQSLKRFMRSIVREIRTE